MRAALVVLGSELHEPKQWAALLEYGRSHRLVPASLVRYDPAAAVALAVDGLVDLVLAPFPDRGGVLQAAEPQIRVVYLRPPPAPARRADAAGAPLIAAMLARGGTPQVVAQLLDVPLQRVEAVAAAMLVRAS